MLWPHRHRHDPQRRGQHPRVPREPRRSPTRSCSSIPSRPTARSRSPAPFPEVKLVQREYFGSAAQKNWAMDQVMTPWLLIVDADERISGAPGARDPAAARGRARGEALLHPPARTSSWTGSSATPAGRPTRSCASSRRGRRATRSGACTRIFRPDGPDADPAHADGPLHVPLARPVPRRSSTATRPGGPPTRTAQGGRRDRSSFSSGRRGVSFACTSSRPGFLDGLHGLVLCGLQAWSVFLKWSKVWEWERFRRNGWPVELPAYDEAPETWQGRPRRLLKKGVGGIKSAAVTRRVAGTLQAS